LFIYLLFSSYASLSDRRECSFAGMSHKRRIWGIRGKHMPNKPCLQRDVLKREKKHLVSFNGVPHMQSYRNQAPTHFGSSSKFIPGTCRCLGDRKSAFIANCILDVSKYKHWIHSAADLFLYSLLWKFFCRCSKKKGSLLLHN